MSLYYSETIKLIYNIVFHNSCDKLTEGDYEVIVMHHFLIKNIFEKIIKATEKKSLKQTPVQMSF